MVFEFLEDGSRISTTKFLELQSKGLLSEDDVLASNRDNSYTVNCVGFGISKEETILVVYPKKYQYDVSQGLADFLPVFSAIQKTRTSRSLLEGGPETSIDAFLNIDYNYPFGAFFQILNHYRRYGLYFDDVRTVTPNRGKINWKRTIESTGFYPVNGRLAFHPLIRESSVRTNNFISEAMIFAINHTIDLFGPLIKANRISSGIQSKIDLESYGAVVQQLLRIRAETFNDRNLRLLDALIEFYRLTNHGRGFYFKSRNFAHIWQAVVGSILRKQKFELSPSGYPVFGFGSKEASSVSVRRVSSFNRANPSQSIEIDHFWLDGKTKTQFVFDAKYYNELVDLDYKQVFYTLLQSLSPEMQGYATISALVVPDVTDGSELHFSLTEDYSKSLPNNISALDIYRLSLSCKDAIIDFQRDFS